jgi:hypothetical protein
MISSYWRGCGEARFSKITGTRNNSFILSPDSVLKNKRERTDRTTDGIEKVI